MAEKKAKKIGTGAASIEAQGRAILENEDRLHDGIDYCLKHRNGEQWPEWEKVALELAACDDQYLSTCIDYASRIRRAKWTELEEILLQYTRDFEEFDYAVRYAKRFGRLPEIEPLLFRENEALQSYMGSVIGTSDWDILDEVVFRDTSNTSADRAFAILARCRTRKSRWRDAEPLMLEFAKVCHRAMTFAVWYAEDFLDGQWQDLEDAVLEGSCDPAATAEYARSTREGVWPELEAVIKSRPLLDDWGRSATLEYAIRVIKGRWHAEEERLKGSAACLAVYASRVIKGRLPDELHDAMKKHLFIGDKERSSVERYFSKYGQ